ncbi:hypothetical protein [Streptomyces sp. NPDC054834]
MRAWQAWKEAAGLTDPDGYAWRRLHNRWHTVLEGGLQPESIGDVVTRAGKRAGIDIRFTGHSPRRGLATSSRLKGHDQIVIAKQGGWAPHSTLQGPRRLPRSRGPLGGQRPARRAVSRVLRAAVRPLKWRIASQPAALLR